MIESAAATKEKVTTKSNTPACFTTRQHSQLWCVGNIENNIAVYFTGLPVIDKACKMHEDTLINELRILKGVNQ